MDPKKKSQLTVLGRHPIFKYILVGGWVTSKNDGQSHYVHPSTVGCLYGIDPQKVYRSFNGLDDLWRLEMLNAEGLTVLRPDPTGEYKLPEEDHE